MFENIIGHGNLVKKLSDMLRVGQLAQSLVIEGPPYNGKLTIALEIARILCCQEKESPHECSCSSCVQHRHRQSQAITILGNRYFDSEIRSCYALAQADISTVPLLINSLRNLTSRFDPRIWTDNQTDVGTIIEDLEDDIQELQHSIISKKLMSNVKRLIACLPKERVPVSAVRHAITQAHYTASLKKRIFIIENADELNISSTNALLKIIEEPPADVYFFLIAKHADALAEALSSRLQRFYLPERKPEEEKTLLAMVFKQSTYNTLRSLIYASFEHSPKELGERMALSLLGKLGYNEYKSCVGTLVADEELLRVCIYELSEVLRRKIRDADLKQLHVLEHCWSAVRVFLSRMTLHIKIEHALDALYYTCKQGDEEHIV